MIIDSEFIHKFIILLRKRGQSLLWIEMVNVGVVVVRNIKSAI